MTAKYAWTDYFSPAVYLTDVSKSTTLFIAGRFAHSHCLNNPKLLERFQGVYEVVP